MLEFLRILGIFIAVGGLTMAVFVFFKMNVPSAITYFLGSENKRLREYQKMQKAYRKTAGSKHSISAHSGSGSPAGESSKTKLDSSMPTQVDNEFANALYQAQRSTTLLDEDNLF